MAALIALAVLTLPRALPKVARNILKIGAKLGSGWNFDNSEPAISSGIVAMRSYPPVARPNSAAAVIAAASAPADVPPILFSRYFLASSTTASGYTTPLVIPPFITTSQNCLSPSSLEGELLSDMICPLPFYSWKMRPLAGRFQSNQGFPPQAHGISSNARFPRRIRSMLPVVLRRSGRLMSIHSARNAVKRQAATNSSGINADLITREDKRLRDWRMLRVGSYACAYFVSGSYFPADNAHSLFQTILRSSAR